jgi:hypothetical protein
LYLTAESKGRKMNGSKIILTMKGAAEYFGKDRRTIADLMASYHITPKPVPLNGMAKGLDLDDLGILAKALNVPAPKLRELRSLAVA